MLSSRHGVLGHCSTRTGPCLLAFGTRQAMGAWANRAGSHLRTAAPVVAPGHEFGVSEAEAKETRGGQLPVLFRLRGWFGSRLRVGVLGSTSELGRWKENDVRVVMHCVQAAPEERTGSMDEPTWFWFGRLPAGKELEFKLVLVDEGNGAFKGWLNDVVGKENLKLKVEEGNTLEVGDLYVEVQPDVELGFKDVGEPDLDAVVEITEEEALEQAQRVAQVHANIAANQAAFAAALMRLKHEAPQAKQQKLLRPGGTRRGPRGLKVVKGLFSGKRS